MFPLGPRLLRANANNRQAFRSLRVFEHVEPPISSQFNIGFGYLDFLTLQQASTLQTSGPYCAQDAGGAMTVDVYIGRVHANEGFLY